MYENTNDLQKLLNLTWDVAYVSHKYGVTGQCVRNWVKRNGMPGLNVPGSRIALRFLPADVLAWRKEFLKKKRKWQYNGNRRNNRGKDNLSRPVHAGSSSNTAKVRGRVRAVPRVLPEDRTDAS